MKIELPKKVLFIINNLQLHGYEAFAVGGCVRDSILAKTATGLGYYDFGKAGRDKKAVPQDD